LRVSPAQFLPDVLKPWHGGPPNSITIPSQSRKTPSLPQPAFRETEG